MASTGKLICLIALISACCLVTEARRQGKTRKVRHVVGAPQKQTMFDIPFEQADSAAGGSAAGGSAAGASTSFVGSDSESSEESDVDMDMDTPDANTDTNEADAADTPVMVGANGNQVGGNLLPFLSDENGMAAEARNANQVLSRTSGSSARGVGIAFAVLGLLTVVVAAAAFTLRKYRHSIPVIVRV